VTCESYCNEATIDAEPMARSYLGVTAEERIASAARCAAATIP
jgi:hypothetical protein